MNAIQISDNKTLKLTNVLSRTFTAEEMGNAMLILTQMDNFIKSHGAQPIGPLIQHVEVSGGANPTATFRFLRQASDFIPRMDPEYHMDAVLRVRNCLYAHYTPWPRASWPARSCPSTLLRMISSCGTASTPSMSTRMRTMP